MRCEYLKESFNKIWSDVSSYLEPTKCTFLDFIPKLDTVLVSMICSRPCLVTKKKTHSETIARVNLKKRNAFISETSAILHPFLEAWSLDKSLLAKVFLHTLKDKPTNYVEIWSRKKILYEISLSDQSLHEKVYDEEMFSSIVWSDQNDKLYYLAETHKQSDENFEYVENFGEELTQVFSPQIFCLDIKNQSVSKVVDLPVHIHPCKLFYGDNKLYFLAYEFPRCKQGIVYCQNKPKSLFVIKDDRSIEKHTEQGRTVVCCAFNPEFPLIFLQERDIGGAHKCAVDLITMNLCDYRSTVLSKNIYIEDFQENIWINEDGCPGIIVNLDSGIDNAMKLRAFRRINDNWQVYDLNTLPNFNYKFLSASSHKIDNTVHLCACSKSSIISPWSLVILKIKFVLGHEQTDIVIIQEIDVFTQEKRGDLPDIYKSFYFDADRKIVERELCVFSGMLVKPINFDAEVSTLVVIPHGGPHSLSTKDYMRSWDYLLQSGYILFIVNYRGSTGFDDKILQSLLGNIGRQDVDDVHLSLLSVCKQEHILSQNIVCFGGSHGGFISAHLLGQYPDIYRAGILRNPVINLIDMFYSSDIPEWVITEAGLPNASACSLDIKYLDELYHKSPIYHADKIKSPVLLFMGKNDKRVPPYQGLQLYRLLKSKNLDVKAFFYNDGHDLKSADTQMSLYYQFSKLLRRIISK